MKLTLGPHTWIWSPRRKSAADPAPTSTLHHEGRSVPLDARGMPADLARLVPHAWGRAGIAEWRPFIERATLHGLL